MQVASLGAKTQNALIRVNNSPIATIHLANMVIENNGVTLVRRQQH